MAVVLVDVVLGLAQGFSTDRMIFRDDELSYALGRSREKGDHCRVRLRKA